MREALKEYLAQLYQCIPQYIFDIAAMVMVIGALLALLIWGFSKGWRKISFLLLVEYLALIFCSTVIFRRTIKNLPVKVIPFERYEKVLNGASEHLEPELLMNVLVFIPLGLLIAAAFKGIKWWQALLAGLGVSLFIEFLQYCFNKGTAEVDDVIHNVAGCMIGYGIYQLIKIGYKKISKRTLDVL